MTSDKFNPEMPASPALQQAQANWPQQGYGPAPAVQPEAPTPPWMVPGAFAPSPAAAASPSRLPSPPPEFATAPAPVLPGYAPPEVARPVLAAASASRPTPVAEIPSIDEVRLKRYDEFDSKLKVFDECPGWEYRWVNDDPHNYARRHAAGYRIVSDPGAALSEVKDNTTPTLFAGTRNTGEGRRAILMARPKQFRDLQDAAFRRNYQEKQTALDPRAAPLRPDGASAGDDATSLSSADRSSFRGQINIAGS